MEEKAAVGIIILAAGESARMGKAKQLLKYNGETLLQRSIKTALDSDCRPIIVVLGARTDLLKGEIKNSDVQIVENLDWNRGMNGSIKTGLEKLLKVNPQISGVLLMVCDQPFVSAELLTEITETYRKKNSLIVASEYAQTLGVPALFSRRIFPQLMTLKDSGGAKKIIEQSKGETVAVTFEEGIFDIDTPDDYLRLIASE